MKAMSLLRMPKMPRVGSAWERLCESFYRAEKPLHSRKHRTLRIDQLEERTLLSVTMGPVTLVNQTTTGLQSTTSSVVASTTDPSYTTGYNSNLVAQLASRYNSRVVAIDHSGDFAVTWISTGQDGDSSATLQDGSVNPNYDPNAATATGVYMRLFDRNDNPLTGEVLVNTYTIGDQTAPCIAMDADGDFVVVWASHGQDNQDGSWGIYGQRFNSVGSRIGGEFLVNTTTLNDQIAPNVAMNSYGQFVVTWASQAQAYSYFNDIRGQVFDADGNRVGNEFRVNSYNIPGPPSPLNSNNEVHPSVAMSDTGSFVVAWDSAIHQKNGVTLDTVVMARLFDATGNPVDVPGRGSSEFVVDIGDGGFVADEEHIAKHRLSAAGGDSGHAQVRRARDAQVAMDAAGNFIIAWESYEDNDVYASSNDVPDSYGVYLRRFNADGTPNMAEDQQANLTITTNCTDPDPVYTSQLFMGDQTHPSIAMDANGDYTVVWDGRGANALALSPDSTDATRDGYDAQGVFVRDFHAGISQGGASDPEAVTPQRIVNDAYFGAQGFASVAKTPDGSYVVVYMGNGTGDSDGVYFVRYKESTDTAGPLLTGALLPDGSSISASKQVSQSLQAIVLTFDAEMYDNAAHSGAAITNPNNYSLLQNGVKVAGGISKVYYGLDVANSLGSQYGLNVPKLNKYQAVLIVDTNGASDGTMPLLDGQYQVTVSSALRDKAGNALLSNAFNPSGSNKTELINIVLPTGQETKVPSGTTPDGASYGKYTYATTADPVASDAQGNYVVAWTDTTPGHEGVWVKMYAQTATLNPAPAGRTTDVTEYAAINPATGKAWANNEIQVSSDTTASDISVARDDDGDFVVTWSAWNSTTGWDVYAQRYSATGQAVGSTFRVNATVAGSQQFSSVATDAQGDFVITWQSQNQDGSGWGVYGQVYNALGEIVGGADEIQAIDFSGGFTGTFVLRWDNDNNAFTPDKVTAPISFNGNASAALADIESALAAIGAKVKAVANGLNEVLIEFVDGSGNANQQPLWISAADLVQTGGTTDATVTVKTISDGKFGEFRVNDTTTGDQLSPDVAMDDTGNFIVTWTSFGQDGDSAVESNVYAKRYAASSLNWYPTTIPSTSSGSVAMVDVTNVNVHPQVSTTDNPDEHVVNSGTGFDGVVQIIGDDYGSEFVGSGALLAGSNWVITAAHCAWTAEYNVPLLPQQLTVAFDLPGGRVYVPVTKVVVSPSYAGTKNFDLGSDLALLQLAFIPVGVQGFALYTDTNEIGKTYDLYGYGTFGTGTAGNVFDVDGYKRHCRNIFDTTGATLGLSDKQLVSDFDDGSDAHDALGVLYGIHNTDSALVASNQEGESCEGDSGGPLLIDGKLAAIVSGGGYSHQPIDVTPNGTDSSFGEISIATRMSSFASWIQSVTNCQGEVEYLVNQNDLLTPVIDSSGKPVTDQLGNPIFYAFDNQSGNQGQSSVAMDADGDFVVTWTSYGHDGTSNNYGGGEIGKNGVFARRYNANTTAASDVFQINQTVPGNQQNPNVAMDEAGDFTITWESSNGTDSLTGEELFNIYARRYARTSSVQYRQGVSGLPALLWSGSNPLYTTDPLFVTTVVITDTNQTVQYQGAGNLYFNNGAIGGEVLVNSTTAGDQRFPGVAVDATGDAVIVWSGNGQQAGQQDPQSVYYQRFTQSADSGSPQVAGALNLVTTNGTTTSEFLPSATVLAACPTQFLITFSEAISTKNGGSGANSILNLANWQLTRSGKVLPGAISKVQYGLNEAYILGLASAPDNKYEVVVTFDGDTSSSGSQSLLAGSYELTILSAVQDLFGNSLDGGFTGAAGNFTRPFTVLADTTVVDSPIGAITAPGNPTTTTDVDVNTYHTSLGGSAPAVAMDGDGDYVVIWGSNRYGDGGDIAFQRYNKIGLAQGSEGTANPHNKTTTNGIVSYASNGVQSEGAVAMDSYGDFVIVWSGDGNIDPNTASTDDATGIYAQIFDKNGKAIGTRIAVNQTVAGVQRTPSVAMDVSGNFVITWVTSDEEIDRSGLNVYGRRFSIQGQALSDEFRVNATAAGAQDNADVAMDSAGDFVVTWQSFGQDGNDWGVYAQRYSAAGGKLGDEFRVNNYTTDKQLSPAVAMDASGDFVIAYSSFGQDGSGYGVYARRYNAAGVALDANEFPVNKTTTNWQINPDVSMASNGNFAITWSSFGQDNAKAATPTSDYGIYARMFNANGTEMTSKAGNAYGEFRINATTAGDQVLPAIAMSASGATFEVVWGEAETYVEPSGPTTDVAICSRLVDPVISTGPKVGSIVVAPADGLMTWNAVDSDGIASATLTIDGTAVTKIYGPMPAASGVNFAGLFGKLAGGNHHFVITVTDKLGGSSTYEGDFGVAANAGPAISNVVVAVTSGLMTWNAADADGVASSSVTIDGATVSKIYGPMTAASGVNFAALFGTPAAGIHNYTITATDKSGNISTLTGKFEVAASPTNTAPTISSVAVAQASGLMTWNVFDTDGVASSSVSVDGVAVSKMYGPMTAASGVNFAGAFGTLGSGEHSFTITATDKLGKSSTYSSKFTVEASGNPGPVISSVAVSQVNGIITWNTLDADGIASSSITIDNKAASKIYGPMAAASGSNFAGTLGTLAAGSHTYVIAATDRLGNSSNITGNFTVAGTTNPGPVIGSVAVSLSSGVITWNALDSDGVRSASVAVDGTNVSKMYGPMSAASGVNFAGVFGTLASGLHSYVITATDALGNSSTYNGQISVAGSSGSGSVYSSSARGAAMRAAATGVSSSAKVDWLLSLPSLSTASKTTSGETEDAVDAIMASY